MTRLRSIKKRLHGQRGAVVILFALLLPVLSGFMALAIDLAYFNLSRVELQNAADAAALAGAHSLSDAPTTIEWIAAEAAAQDMAHSNSANGAKISDVTIEKGSWNLSSSSFSSPPVAGDLPAISATITIDRTHNSGPLKLFFAHILGIANPEIQASAIAAQSAPGHSILVQ